MDNQNKNQMDSNPYAYNQGGAQPPHTYHQTDRHSTSMANASLALGILALISSPCVLTGIVFGALALILGILSRGGQMKYVSPAIVGIVSGALGILCSVGFFVFMFAVSIQQFGGIDGFIQEYMKYLEMYGIDTSALKAAGF